MEFTIFPLQSEQDLAFFTEEEYQSARENNVILTDRPEEEAKRVFLSDLDGYIERFTQNQVYLAKTQTGEYAGMLWLAERISREPWDFSDTAGWVYDIRVRTEYRGQGLGRALLTKAEEWARECGFPEIGLHVYGANKAAINLYLTQGFSINTTIMQKDITPENLHPTAENITFRDYLPDKDHKFVHRLLFLQYQAKALASGTSTKEQVKAGFERCLNTYNFGNPRKEIIIAEDDHGSRIGVLWFYKSKGDLGKRRHVWLHSAQVVDPIHLPDLLSFLEQWVVEQEIDAIRTPVHQIEKQTMQVLQSHDYFPANLIMNKTIGND